MKKRLLKIALLLLAVLTTGSVNAATETYDFKTIASTYVASSSATVLTNEADPGDHSNRIAWDATNKIGVFKLSFSDGNEYNNTFNNRFACATGKYSLRNKDAYTGLWNQTYDNLFAILDLAVGDKITITQNSGETNYFKYENGYSSAALTGVADQGTLTSGKEYTVSTAGNLVLRAPAAGIHVEKIVIETPSVSVPVTINVIPEMYDFTTVDTEGTTVLPTWGTEVTSGGVKLNMLAAGTETYDNRFAVGPTTRNTNDGNGFKFRNASSSYKGLYSQYGDRNISVLNLKAGDKVTFTISNNDETLQIVGGAKVVSGQAITISADGNLDLVTTGSVYIESIKIEPSTGTYIGATLVSSYALDFTDVEGITAYVATAANAGSVTFSPVTKVAANTPLYIKANEESGSVINVNVPEATEGAVDYSATNLLKGSASSTTSLSTGDTKYYVFGVKSNEAGFYPVSTSSTFTSAAGKAYLQLNAGQAGAARSIRMIFGDGSDITGINTAVVEKESRDDAWYTLQGARVSKPAHGIYIKNGKKIFVK